MSEKLYNDIEMGGWMKTKMVYVNEDITGKLQYLKLEDVLVNLTELAKKYPVETQLGLEMYDDYGDRECRVVLRFERPQTEEEKNKEEHDKRRYEASRRQQYENLKREFEK